MSEQQPHQTLETNLEAEQDRHQEQARLIAREVIKNRLFKDEQTYIEPDDHIILSNN